MRLNLVRDDRATGEWRPADAAGPVGVGQLSCATFNVWFADLVLARLHHDPACAPVAYYRGARQFLTLLPDGRCG